jgi:tetratricopeptide (TPR) repeat protein
MERARRQQSNQDYWEQAQNLRPLDIAARAEMLASEEKTQEAYAEFERSLKAVAKRYGNPSPQMELARRRFITFCWAQKDYVRIHELALANLRCKQARVGSLDPSFQSRLGDLAGACYFLGRHHEAENYARQMLAIAIMQPNPWKHLGDQAANYVATFAAARGDHEQAIDLLNQALAWAAKDPFAGLFDIERYADKLAKSYEALGKFKESSDVLTKYQPRKETFPDRNLVTVFRFFWRLFNLGFKFRKPQDAILDANIAYITAALPKIGLRSDTREIYFLMDMLKARLLKFRGKKPEAKEAFAKIYDTYLNEFPVADGMLSWTLSDLAELWNGPDHPNEEAKCLRLAIACLEDAGLAKGPDYARLHNRLGLWHSGMQSYQASIECYRKALAALEPGEEPRLQANLYWNIGLGEAALIGFARLEALQKAWKATPAGQSADKGLEPFLRLQETFKEVHWRFVIALGPNHPDTLKALDFIQKSLS